MATPCSTLRRRAPISANRFAKLPTARRADFDPWESDDPRLDPFEPFDPNALEAEPEPEPGDFWLEPDDDEA